MKYLFAAPGRGLRGQPAEPGVSLRQALFGSLAIARV
jgi:hypothetical protein